MEFCFHNILNSFIQYSFKLNWDNEFLKIVNIFPTIKGYKIVLPFFIYLSLQILEGKSDLY